MKKRYYKFLEYICVIYNINGEYYPRFYLNYNTQAKKYYFSFKRLLGQIITILKCIIEFRMKRQVPRWLHVLGDYFNIIDNRDDKSKSYFLKCLNRYYENN